MENRFRFGFQHSDSTDSGMYKYFSDLVMILVFTNFICLFGLVGNGIVLWLLGFSIKRNPFTTYILNLTASDFGLLLVLFHFNISLIVYVFSLHLNFPFVVLNVLLSPLLLMYSSGQFLLTIISIDRCVAVLCPHWYYGHRSPNLSTTVCATIWVLLFLLCGIQLTLLYTGKDHYFEFMVFHQCFVIISICMPLMTTSTLTLFIKVCPKLQTHQYGKLLIVVLLTLLFALLFSSLTSASFIAIYFQVDLDSLYMYLLICVSLRSSIHLVIYLLVGRWKDCQFLKNMKVTLQRVFREVEQEDTP